MISECLNQLKIIKTTLANNLTTKNIASTDSEVFMDLANKVLDIESNSGKYIAVCPSEPGDTVQFTSTSDNQVYEQINETETNNDLVFFIKNPGLYKIRYKKTPPSSDYESAVEIWSEEKSLTIEENIYVYNIEYPLFKKLLITLNGLTSSSDAVVTVKNFNTQSNLIHYTKAASSQTSITLTYYWPCGQDKNLIQSLQISCTNGVLSKSDTINTENNNYNNQNVILNFVSAIFENNTWAIIQSTVKAGDAPSYWSVGDTKSVTLTGGIGDASNILGDYKIFILGFNHNASKEGNNSIHLSFKDSFNTQIAFTGALYEQSSNLPSLHMNESDTNSGGWKDSFMRNTHMNKFLQNLPQELSSILGFANKYTNNAGLGSTNISSTKDKVFLLSEYEVTGSISKAASTEKNYQQQYDYFKNGNSKRFYKHDSPNTVACYWLRSPSDGSSGSFCAMNPYDTIQTFFAANSYGLVPVICIS